MKAISVFITLAYLILGATQSYALPPKWFKIMECNFDEIVVDEATIYPDPRPNYQLVLRGRPLQHFVRSGAIDKKYVNEKDEFVLHIYSNGYGELSGSAPNGKDHNGSYISRRYVLQKHFDVLTLRALVNQNPDSKEITNWVFTGCRYQTSEP